MIHLSGWRLPPPPGPWHTVGRPPLGSRSHLQNPARPVIPYRGLCLQEPATIPAAAMAGSLHHSGSLDVLLPSGKSKQVPWLVDAVPASPGGPRLAVCLMHGASGGASSGHLPALAAAVVSAGWPCLRFTCKGGSVEHRAEVCKVRGVFSWGTGNRAGGHQKCRGGCRSLAYAAALLKPVRRQRSAPSGLRSAAA